MSGRRLASGLGGLMRRGGAQGARSTETSRASQVANTIHTSQSALGTPANTRLFHSQRLSVGGLQRLETTTMRAARRRLGFPVNGYHNAVAVRNASFVRMIPKLMLKFVRIPATFGGLMIGAAAWVQYQAIQVGNSAYDVFVNTRDSVGSAASSFWDGAVDIAGQTRQGWDQTKDQLGVSGFWDKIAKIQEDIGNSITSVTSSSGDGSSGSGGPGNGKDPKEGKGGAAAAAATGAAYYGANADGDDDDDDKSKRSRATENARDDQMMVFTKKMIEIRNILQKVGQSSSLTLPSIVVIGSQSSGKSSVLEAIVGHEFLPKGTNMVTRRPIELTLVNTPESKAEYGEFPDLGLRKLTDFTSIQRTLTELNMAVPDSECVSDDPIHLTIYSPNVPDLSLIDLPGYIQVVGHNQPLELKQKISELCDKYIQAPNVILAISAADVDLANSTALRASRRVDPRGERTIGVVTKMDLVDATRGAAILQDKQYPLRLGYVGVVSRAPQSLGVGLFKKTSGDGSALMNLIAKNEESFFGAHPLEFGQTADVSVGTTVLRKKLMHVLEQTMSASLQGTTDAIRQELEEATYEFKVQYNDRPLSAESYLAESLDAFKHSFKQYAEGFGRPQMHALLKRELDQRVLDLLAQRYWNKPITDLTPVVPDPDALSELPKAAPDSLYWHRQLDASTSQLTKLGIGRLATNVVATSIQAGIDKLISQSNFVNHPFARQAIQEAASTILNDRFYSTSDQVENCIKPYKFEIELEGREWDAGREHAASTLKQELVACQDAMKRLESSVGGRRRLNEVVTFVDKARRGDVIVEGDGRSGAGGFSAALLQLGREGAFLRDRADIINMRLLAAKSKQCRSADNKYYCPEVFLDAVATKLAGTAVLFLNVELLSEFYYNFPRELDQRLGRHLTEDEIERFAKEDPKIKRHLDVIRRKDLLELVLEKMESLRQLEGREKSRRTGGVGQNEKQSGSRWGIF
ncbi:mitochondrial dynamin gtpase [Ophiostoma piceae UAMH 11346]|uniref:dynamin GTPase n=1 Tax=Ophiostoma piceae (strain UAMH 11346) TaxID=1262450 RepID=S3C517_OPHP1|nr:mitochondrial dynamin gtpase [Ophiostoma piceae UAMH 11346]